MNRPKHRRISWKVRRAPDGWLPIVLIGEEPLVCKVQASRAAARLKAREKAAELSRAGQG